jgi:UrcA family protein
LQHSATGGTDGATSRVTRTRNRHRPSAQSDSYSSWRRDLATPQDATELYRRIQRAARFVCNDVAYNWDERRALNWLKCFNDTVDHAVMQVNRPTLLAVHRQKSKSATG